MIDILVLVFALGLLMLAAYRGWSVILFSPICALAAICMTDVSQILPLFSEVFMEKVASFLKLYFPVFMLGALFGKVIELSGFSKSIVVSVIRLFGVNQVMFAVVFVGALLTYGGVSLFVVVFAIYPFAAELFRKSNIPKRLIPATIALGAFTFTMDSLPGTPQLQNIIPTTFFKTTTWAAPISGILGSIFILVCGLSYLQWRGRVAFNRGEGYGTGHRNEPERLPETAMPSPFLAILPLLLVAFLNKYFTFAIPQYFGSHFELAILKKVVIIDIEKWTAIWAVEVALVVGIIFVICTGFKQIAPKWADGSHSAVTGSLVASMNTASEYGFGSVIAGLPGFTLILNSLNGISNPLIHQAISVTTLAGITGSASGGLSIALAAMGDSFIEAASLHQIPLEVLHRVASMASGGMDTLPHNGAVITLLLVTGLTHKSSYGDIFVLTLIKTTAVFVVIGLYVLFNIY